MTARLALEGGAPLVPEGLVQSWPPLTEADREAVLAVFDSGHLHGTTAPLALAVQEQWARYVGTKYALVTNSGTAALHMGLAAVGVGPGDEVITSAITYWSTAAAILHHNAIPIFVDIDPRTYTLDPARVEERITDHTRALLPVHIFGMPADMDPLNRIAEQHGLAVVEDACQAHGASYRGVRAGALGDVGCFSCNRSKNLSSGEGGLLTTDHEDYCAVAAKMSGFGAVALSGGTGPSEAWGLGWGCRPHEFVNALMLSQLPRLEEYNATRRRLADHLTSRLAAIPGFEGPYTPDYAEPCYWTYVVEFRPEQLGLSVSASRWRQAAERALSAEGLSLGQWPPLPGHEVFQSRAGYGRGCPWTCPFGGGGVTYDPAEYPHSRQFVETHSQLGGVYPPNDLELMELYLQAFKRVSQNAEKVLQLTEE